MTKFTRPCLISKKLFVIAFGCMRPSQSRCRTIVLVGRFPSPLRCNLQSLEKGRVHFTVRNLFQTSLCLRGSTSEDSWFMVDVEFLINIGGDLTGLEGGSYSSNTCWNADNFF